MPMPKACSPPPGQSLQQAGQYQEVARVDLNLGVLAYRRGNYQGALRYLESAHRGFAAIPIPGEVAVVSLYRSFVYRDLNLFQEMITLAAEATQTFEQETTRWQQAMALINQGIGYQRLGIHMMAEQLFKKARRILRQRKAQARVLMLDVDRANLFFEMNQVDTACRLARRLEPHLEQHPSPSLAARLHILLARCAFNRDPPDQTVARQRTATALAIARTHHLTDVTIDAYYLLGQILEQAGDEPGALHHYRTAMQTIEQVRSGLPVDEFQMSFMDNKLPIYEDVVRLSQHLESPVEVFYTLNLAHRAPFVALTPVMPTSTSSLPDDPTLTTRLRELRETWHWYQSKLEGMGQLDTDTAAIQQDAATEDRMRQQLHELETSIADLTRRWQVGSSSQPAAAMPYAAPASQLFAPAQAQAFRATIQQSLGLGELLLHYTVIAGQFHIMLLTRTTIQMLPAVMPAAPLQRVLRSWRFQMEHMQGDMLETGRNATHAHLTRFYTALVAPLEPYLTGYEHIFLVVPPGWHDLPIAAFFDGRSYLVERFRLTYLSAPEVLLNRSTQHPLPPAHPDLQPAALIMGYSDDGRLPYALEEVHQVASALQPYLHTTVVVEDAATMDCLRAASQHIHLLHFATHAAFRQDNPLFSWMRLVDARLTVADLCEMTLPQRPLVVLSACETGRGQPRGGGLLGMGRGFLAAGASGLIVGLWKVADHTSAQFMTDLYTSPRTAHPLSDPAAALHTAQLCALSRHHPPFVWAGFIFIQG
ncbi:MAG: CHAT domain-containing protein [Chloroflexaceae bacterium]|nr:CHAT domain-containing protein [Chloroflexaceae bacterium]